MGTSDKSISNGKKIIIIGTDVSGMIARIYACKAGFEVEIYESHVIVRGWRTTKIK